MNATAPHTRKLALGQLATFARNARAALSQAGIVDLDHAGVFQKHLSARCCLCDTRASSAVVGALFTGATLEAGRPAEELARLRQEYCLRLGCDSRFYELTFAPHPAVNWTAIGTEAPTEAPPAYAGLAVGSAVVSKAAQTVRGQFSWRLVAVAVALLALLAWRQWWTGGSIPFFREAKPFISEGVGPEPMADDVDPK